MIAWKEIVRGLLSIALLLAFSALSAAQAPQYRTYANERFGTTAEVPADWNADPPPENGDGLVFRSPDGHGSVTVSGSLHIWDSIDEAMRIFDQPENGERITYRHREPRALVVSGTRGDMIFYAKHILSCRDQVWNDLHIEYPAGEKAAYDAVVTHISRSLRPGRSAQVEDCN